MLRSFTGLDIETIVVSRYPGDVTRYSRYCRDWRGVLSDQDWNEAEVVDRLVDIARDEPVPPVLYYGDDAMLRLVSRYREKLSEYYRFNIPPEDIVALCTCKKDFENLSRQKGIPVPHGLQSTPEMDCKLIATEIGFPCILKPGSHVGWFSSDAIQSAGGSPRKVLLANDREECESALQKMRKFSSDFIVQEYIHGGEEQIYSFHTYIPRGDMKRTAYIGKKIRTYPSMGGESTYIELVEDSALVEVGLDVLDKLDISGPVKIDMKKDPRTGKIYVLEINLRFNLWNYLGTRCGINLPYIAYMDICGFNYAPPVSYRTDTCWLNFNMDLRSFVTDYYPSGQLTVPAWLRSYMRPKIYAFFAWRDPLPFLVETTMRNAKSVAKRIIRRPE